MNRNGNKSDSIKRKPRPSPPHWFWADTDDCWDCICSSRGCNSCKRLKKFRRRYRDKKQNQKDD